MLKRTSGVGRRLSSSALRGFALVITASIALAACGGGSKSPAASGTPGTGKANGSQPPSEEFGMTETQLVTSIERGEGLIASCMASAGFKYIAIDAVTFREAMKGLGGARGLSDKDYVTQYGYGITTRPPATEVFGVGAQNAAVLKNLTPSNQVAYKRTLLGDDTKATFVSGLEREDFSKLGGCTRSAVTQVFKPEDLKDTYFNPIDKQIEADPRTVAARAKWSSCMRTAGYDYGHPDDIEKELRDQLAKLADGAEPASLTGRSKDALTELQGKERAVGLADFDCLEKFVNSVTTQVEQDLLGR